MSIHPNPLTRSDTSSLRCDRCGRPARWRPRVVTGCCTLGQTVCDACDDRSDFWQTDDDFWPALRQDVTALGRNLVALLWR